MLGYPAHLGFGWILDLVCSCNGGPRPVASARFSAFVMFRSVLRLPSLVLDFLLLLVHTSIRFFWRAIDLSSS